MLIPGMVKTNFYHGIKVSSRLNQDLKRLPYTLEAFSVPIEEVGESFADIINQEPGKETGKYILYCVEKGWQGMFFNALVSIIR